MAFMKGKKKPFKKKRRNSDYDVFEPKRIRKKHCKWCGDKTVWVDYKEINRIRMFVSERGKIVPKRISGNCSKHQRQLTEAVKKLRNLAILPFISD